MTLVDGYLRVIGWLDWEWKWRGGIEGGDEERADEP